MIEDFLANMIISISIGYTLGVVLAIFLIWRSERKDRREKK
jgi:NhaP-type Na+/H+ or K+/H+ antiporter